MQIMINYSGVECSDSLASHTNESIDRSFGRFSDRLTRAEVHLSDLNGADKQGPHDKRCLIEVRPKGRDPLVVEDRNEDFYNAITNAADKMRSALEKRLERD